MHGRKVWILGPEAEDDGGRERRRPASSRFAGEARDCERSEAERVGVFQTLHYGHPHPSSLPL